ncbi:MAG: PBP1A family penicillin-binding protein [Bacteroidetes bacterium]|nr:PBP1A family penicillin-binding protein [Bacteroidota bacterium]MBU1115506.1 PBP1A family penicillin-binding protein [Bacteroidota bacterium]MBU1799558.1 PBP1A family penicillin-binding protein [Bacteroidota bacterium]
MAKESVRINKKKKSKIRTFLWSLVLFLFLFTVIGGFFFYKNVIDGLPSLEQLENPKQSLASVILSSDGEEIGRFFRESRTETRIDSIPNHLIEALISTEDKKFREHWGVDLQRVVNGIVKTILLGKRQGGSTITQQLAKNLYDFKVVNENFLETMTRKVREVITAVQIEKTYTKNEILEMYFNISYFGRGAYGISMASRIFFNKNVQELTIPESAVLIALLKSSVIYDPERRYNNALQRRNVVMNEMWEDEKITEEQYRAFSEMPIEVFIEESRAKFHSSIAPHFIEYIRQQMEDMSEKYGYDLYEDGLTIYTSLDTRMQKIANEVVKAQIDEIQKQFDKLWDWRKNRKTLDDLLNKAIKNNHAYRKAESKDEKNEIYNSLKRNVAFVDSVQKIAQTIEVGFVVLDSKTGDIRAMVGGRDVEKGRGLNHVTQIRRQPGSSFKPIIYTVALDNGLYPAFPILNQPFEVDGWSPRNFVENEIGGFLTLREGIKNSVNLVAARLIIEGHVPLYKVGLYAKKMGINYKLNLFNSIALGSSEVVPLELASVYGTIANRGIYNEPLSIQKFVDKNGILIESFTSKSHEAISEETAYTITNMLETVVNEGTAQRIRSIHHFYRPAAGKTGTNGDYKDAWFMGFTPQLTAGVWVGFDDQRIAFTGAYGQGAKVAAPIWGEFMRGVYDSLKMEIEGFSPPKSGDIVSVSFCKNSIYEMGSPRLYSDECSSGKLSDIINIRDIPKTFNSDRDTAIVLFDKYGIVDSNSHEAKEIVD